MDFESITRESPLWLDGGNVILTSAAVVFKVHRSILERHSEVLRDIFKSPQHARLEFCGVPVMRMSDDPRDLECFLLALYDGIYFEQYRASNFVVVRGVLRLSIKYTVEHLRNECLKLLQHDWPMTLAGWDLRERESTSVEGAYESSLTRPHPIYVINLAHELGEVGVTLLPAAFYDLSRYNCSHIWTGCAPVHMNSEGSAVNVRETDATLSLMDLRAVTRGKEASQSFVAQFLRRELEDREVAVSCENWAYQEGLQCRIAFEDLAHELYRGVVGVTCGRDSDPLFTLDAAVVMQCRAEDGGLGIHPASSACEECRADFTQVAQAARQYVWDQLPCWFGLAEILQRS